MVFLPKLGKGFLVEFGLGFGVKGCTDADAQPLLQLSLNPLPSLGNNTTLEKIDGVIGYSYTCVDNGEVVVIYGVGRRGGIGIIV